MIFSPSSRYPEVSGIFVIKHSMLKTTTPIAATNSPIPIFPNIIKITNAIKNGNANINFPISSNTLWLFDFFCFLFYFFMYGITHYSGNSISLFILTNPYFSYNGRPISVASNEIDEIPLLLISLISISNVL